MNTATRTEATPSTFADCHLVGYTEHPRMSQETIAFDADVYHRDTLLGTLSNDGQGGAPRFTADNAETHKTATTVAAEFPGIYNTTYGFTYDLFESLAQAGDIAKTLLGIHYVSLVPNMSIEAILGDCEELDVFRAPRKAGGPHALALGLLEDHPEVNSVVYPMRERGGVWLYEITR